ncbi:MAG: nucleotidyltransferase domain-containing protein [Mycobacteriales bacterium]
MPDALDLPDDPDLWRWAPFDPSSLVDVMRGYDGLWAVAGGWALELALGLPARVHHDVDVATLRRDQHELQRHFAGWQLYYATPQRELIRWDAGQALQLPVHGIWVRRTDDSPWLCEFLLNEADGDDWVYRRDPRVRLPLDRLVSSYDGLPVLNPAVALLYKSKNRSAKDEADFAAAHPRLSAGDREWLRAALPAEHPWRARLTP